METSPTDRPQLSRDSLIMLAWEPNHLNSGFVAFNCNRRDAHQLRTSNSQSLWQCIGFRNIVVQLLVIGIDVVVELMVVPEQFSNIFCISDELDRAQYRALQHWAVDIECSGLRTTSAECLPAICQVRKEPIKWNSVDWKLGMWIGSRDPKKLPDPGFQTTQKLPPRPLPHSETTGLLAQQGQSRHCSVLSETVATVSLW